MAVADKPILLAAGGTGGHLFPAFALAEELKRRGRTVDLVTDERGEKYGIGFPGRTMHYVPAATFAGKNPIAAFSTVTTLGKGVLKARTLIKAIGPCVVAGFGGYPTFPPLVAARLARIPTLVHEANAVIGRANATLLRHVSAIALSWDSTKGVPEGMAGKVTITGNPVRDAVVAAANTPFPRLWTGADIRILVFGGSQGARYFSDTVPPALAALPAPVKKRVRLVQQCRDEDMARVKAAYHAAGIQADLAPFFKDLPQRMAASHLVIARSGASTTSELTVLGRPSILVPLPHSIDNDQLINANRLAEAGAAWCMEQQGLTPEKLSREILALIESPERLNAAAAAAKKVGKPDAVKLLADVVTGLAGAR